MSLLLGSTYMSIEGPRNRQAQYLSGGTSGASAMCDFDRLACPTIFREAARKGLQTVGNCLGVIPLLEFAFVTNGK